LKRVHDPAEVAPSTPELVILRVLHIKNYYCMIYRFDEQKLDKVEAGRRQGARRGPTHLPASLSEGL
jgi:hypothetical protein